MVIYSISSTGLNGWLCCSRQAARWKTWQESQEILLLAFLKSPICWVWVCVARPCVFPSTPYRIPHACRQPLVAVSHDLHAPQSTQQTYHALPFMWIKFHLITSFPKWATTCEGTIQLANNDSHQRCCVIVSRFPPCWNKCRIYYLAHDVINKHFVSVSSLRSFHFLLPFNILYFKLEPCNMFHHR